MVVLLKSSIDFTYRIITPGFLLEFIPQSDAGQEWHGAIILAFYLLLVGSLHS